MKNIIIFAPVKTGRTWISKRIKEELGYKGTIIVADEIYEGDTLKQISKDFFMLGIGYANSTPEQELKWEQERKSPRAAMGIEWFAERIKESKKVKATAEKYGFKYFDSSDFTHEEILSGKSIEIILAYVKKEMKL